MLPEDEISSDHGWTEENLPPWLRGKVEFPHGVLDTDELAMQLLGLNKEERQKLFFVDVWPVQFQDAYHFDQTVAKRRARVLASRVAHFLKTGE